MGRVKRFLILAASSSLLFEVAANAAPIVNLKILGSKTQGSGYVSNLALTPADVGLTIFIEVKGSIAPLGTSNLSTDPIDSTNGTTSSDGISALRFTLNSSDAATAFSNFGRNCLPPLARFF